jgi:ferric-dicitrate binding protein FerR (iron transport regulator)
LIKKFKNEQLSSEERASFDMWISSNDNKKIYNDYLEVWNLTKKLPTRLNPNVDLEWNKFKRKVDTNKKAKVGIKRVVNFRLFAAASVILLFGLISILKLYNKEVKYVSDNSVLSVVLPDSSNIVLNKNSVLIVSKGFSESNRNVELQGEAFFQIKRDTANVFIVRLGNGLDVTVLGTEFNIKNRELADVVKLEVVSGKVLFKDNNQHITVSKGMGVNFVSSENKFKDIRKIDNNGLAWRTNKLYFDNSLLTDVAEDIEQFLGKQIVLPPNASSLRYTGTFDNSSEKDIVSTLALAMGWSYEISDGVIIFTKKSINNTDK